MNIDLPRLAATTDFDNACAGVNEPLSTLAVAVFDDPVEVIDGVGLILNGQGFGLLIGGQTFLQGELGEFLPSSWTCQ